MAKVRSVSFFVSSFLDLVSTCFGACSASTHFALVLFPGRWCLVSACWLGRSNHKQVQVSRQEGRGGKGIVCIFFFGFAYKRFALSCMDTPSVEPQLLACMFSALFWCVFWDLSWDWTFGIGIGHQARRMRFED